MNDLTSVLDEDLKRLLAAILEFSLVMRRDEPGVDKPDQGLGLSRAMRDALSTVIESNCALFTAAARQR